MVKARRLVVKANIVRAAQALKRWQQESKPPEHGLLHGRTAAMLKRNLSIVDLSDSFRALACVSHARAAHRIHEVAAKRRAEQKLMQSQHLQAEFHTGSHRHGGCQLHSSSISSAQVCQVGGGERPEVPEEADAAHRKT